MVQSELKWCCSQVKPERPEDARIFKALRNLYFLHVDPSGEEGRAAAHVG